MTINILFRNGKEISTKCDSMDRIIDEIKKGYHTAQAESEDKE